MTIPIAVFAGSLLMFSGCAALFPAALPDLPVTDTYRSGALHLQVLPPTRAYGEAVRLGAWWKAASPSKIMSQFAARLGSAYFSGGNGFQADGGWGWSQGVAPELMEMVASGSSALGNALSNRSADCTPHIKPDAAGFFVVHADLHVHSAYSHDSAATLRQIFLQAARKGIRVLAITDHDWFTWPKAEAVYRSMRASGELCAPILLIPAMEVSSSDGHVLAYFIQSTIEPGLNVRETVRQIHSQGGLAFLPHPHRPQSGIHGPAAAAADADGYETINGAQLFPAALLQEGAGDDMPQGTKLGGSDAHFSGWVGQVSTRLAVVSVSSESVREALVVGRTRPEIRGPVFGAWYRFWQKPVAGWFARSLAVPRKWWDRLRMQVSNHLGADDFDIQTSWEVLGAGAYSLWQLPVAVQSFVPRGIWMPLPESVGLRYGPLQFRSRWLGEAHCGWLRCLQGWPSSWQFDVRLERMF